jgi:hypothetical protein
MKAASFGVLVALALVALGALLRGLVLAWRAREPLD